MKKLVGLVAILLAGVLLSSGNGWFGTRVSAQSAPEKLTDQQYQELQKKRQEQWDNLERIQQRQENVGQRKQEAEKRQKDAAKRQKQAESALEDDED
jgi:septal ring factor EnvC (AmiA/AmiB activator)